MAIQRQWYDFMDRILDSKLELNEWEKRISQNGDDRYKNRKNRERMNGQFGENFGWMNGWLKSDS